MLLLADFRMIAAPQFLCDLRTLLGDRLSIVWLKEPLNYMGSLGQVLSTIRSLLPRRFMSKAWDSSSRKVNYRLCAPTVYRMRRFRNLNHAKIRKTGFGFRGFTFEPGGPHVLFHLRQDDFRGWKSPRSGREPAYYNALFRFLRNLNLRPILLSSSAGASYSEADSIPLRGAIRADEQLSLIKNAFMLIGSYSGPTHLGPGYGVPTLNFDLPWPLTWLNHGHDLFLLKGIRDAKGERKDPLTYYQYRPDFNPDADGELPIQKAGYELVSNNAQELILGFLELLIQLERNEKTCGHTLPSEEHSRLRKKILKSKEAEKEILMLSQLRPFRRAKSFFGKEHSVFKGFNSMDHAYGTLPLSPRQLALANWAYALPKDEGLRSAGLSAAGITQP